MQASILESLLLFIELANESLLGLGLLACESVILLPSVSDKLGAVYAEASQYVSGRNVTGSNQVSLSKTCYTDAESTN